MCRWGGIQNHCQRYTPFDSVDSLFKSWQKNRRKRKKTKTSTYLLLFPPWTAFANIPLLVHLQPGKRKFHEIQVGAITITRLQAWRPQELFLKHLQQISANWVGRSIQPAKFHSFTGSRHRVHDDGWRTAAQREGPKNGCTSTAKSTSRVKVFVQIDRMFFFSPLAWWATSTKARVR